MALEFELLGPVTESPSAMTVQIEITTRCNYACFYCAGRDMVQEHMSWQVFEDILGRVPPGRRAISLQGEGEPTTHPRLWDMAAEVRCRGHVPYTITNGSWRRVELIARHFPTVGISLDTLDAGEAERIGRHNLGRVLKNLEKLQSRMDARRIIIHTADYGQPLQPLRDFVTARGFRRHIVQPLQVKDDYACRYRDRIPLRPLHRATYRCRYVERPLMRYYDIRGVEMPCCHINDCSKFLSVERIRESLARREVPQSCAGCREIFPQTEAKRARNG